MTSEKGDLSLKADQRLKYDLDLPYSPQHPMHDRCMNRRVEGITVVSVRSQTLQSLFP